MAYKLQVIAQSLQDAREAQAGGASNLEVTVDLAVGGLTPSLNLVRTIREAVTIDLHVMVRPYAPNFVYTSLEVEEILTQVKQLKSLGADGIVFGALQPNSSLATDVICRVAEVAHPLSVTLHRAIDVSRNAEAGLESLRGTVGRVLTSGGAKSAWEGRETIRRWVEGYDDSYRFICGAGVTLDDVVALVQTTRAPEYHVGSGVRSHNRVDRGKVKQMVDALAGILGQTNYTLEGKTV